MAASSPVCGGLQVFPPEFFAGERLVSGRRDGHGAPVSILILVALVILAGAVAAFFVLKS